MNMQAKTPSADWFLAQYALGTLPRAGMVLAETYLALNPGKVPAVRQTENVGGWALDGMEPVAMRGSALALLAGAEATPANDDKAARDGGGLPDTLADIIGMPLSDVPWRWRGFGTYEYRLKALEDDGIVARLIKVHPGRGVAQHTHEGLEATLLLDGAYAHEGGRFARGDLELATPDIDHRPTAEGDRDCICFAVSEAPMRFTGRIGRLFDVFFN